MHLFAQPVDLQVGALAVQCDQQTICCGLDVQAQALAVQRQLQATVMLVSELCFVRLAMKLKLERPADRPVRTPAVTATERVGRFQCFFLL